MYGTFWIRVVFSVRNPGSKLQNHTQLKTNNCYQVPVIHFVSPSTKEEKVNPTLHCHKLKKTSAVTSRISSKLIPASCVG